MPAPEIVFDDPLMITLPALVVMLPLTDKFPVMVMLLLVVIVPETVRLSKLNPVPVIVLVVPDKVKAPPDEWVKAPLPVLDRFPETVILVVDAAVTAEPVMIKL